MDYLWHHLVGNTSRLCRVDKSNGTWLTLAATVEAPDGIAGALWLFLPKWENFQILSIVVFLDFKLASSPLTWFWRLNSRRVVWIIRVWITEEQICYTCPLETRNATWTLSCLSWRGADQESPHYNPKCRCHQVTLKIIGCCLHVVPY